MGQETFSEADVDADAHFLERTSQWAAVGIPLVERFVRLLIVAVVSALVYSTVVTASRGTCAGGVDAQGRFIDAAGAPIDSAPLCYQLTLHPSGLMLVLIAVIVLIALSRVIGRALHLADAVRTLDRTTIAIVVSVGIAAVISHVWFWTIPMDSWGETGFSVWSPVPFGAIELEVSRMGEP